MPAKSICKSCTHSYLYGTTDMKKRVACNTINPPRGRFPLNVKECPVYNKKGK